MSKHGITKDRIINASEGFFSKYGYYGTSMSDISKATGIRKSSLYSHFDSKEQLFLKVYQGVLDNAASEISRIFFQNDLSDKDKLHQMFTFFCHSESTDILRIGLHPNPECQEQTNEILHKFEEGFKALLSGLFRQIRIQSANQMSSSDEDCCEVFFFLLNGVMIKKENYSADDYPRKVELAWNTFCQWAKIE